MQEEEGATIVVAAPIAAPVIRVAIQNAVDTVVVIEAPQDLDAVSQGHIDFENLTDG